uniref:Uncharacterized protein n=1 Tax=Peronospora matthiolae TaxID=2874970 RepID=A0AAV1VEN9_9STRA
MIEGATTEIADDGRSGMQGDLLTENEYDGSISTSLAYSSARAPLSALPASDSALARRALSKGAPRLISDVWMED